MEEALTLVLAYFIGSVPVTWLIFYWRTGKDLRTVGDGNVGSANAIHEGVGWWLGRTALLLDVGKGLLAVSIARWLDLDHGWWMGAGYLVMIGHMFPVWLRFNGGRAAATAMGASGAFLPWQFGVTMATGGTAFLLFRIAELGIVLVVAPLPFIAIAFDASAETIAFCFSAPIVAGAKAGLDRWLRQRSSRQPLPTENPT
jgi:glycerol-3-phosphate acyltransferase PlsY